MTPWPRVIRNYPIILIAVVYQYLLTLCLVWDPSAANATAVHALILVFRPFFMVPFTIFGAATLAWLGFLADRKLTTVLCLVPQQLLLFLGAGGAVVSVWVSHYADGVIRPQSFMLADQSPEILIAIFHSWAMVLILLYGADNGR